MTRNVTIRMDEELLTAFRHKAVDARMSLSAWIVENLSRTIEEDRERENSRLHALARLEKGYNLGGKPLARDEAHGR